MIIVKLNKVKNMKKIIIVSSVILFVGIQICSCSTANAQTTSVNQQNNNESKTINLKITGMTCSGCSNNIHSALSKKDGILENEITFPGDVAIVKYDPNKITENEIIATIEKAGYKAEVKKEELKKENGKSDKKCDANCKKSCCSNK